MISIPKEFISQKDINNWERYSTGLKDNKFVKKYLETTLKKWVGNLSNPLSINWVQWLYKNKLKKLNEHLEAFENRMGEENLTSIFSELKKEGDDTETVIIKIRSLTGEIIAFNKLISNGHKNLKKISEGGDWESETAIISVKSILDLDLNYQLIENTIQGMVCIKENGILRKYSKIRLHDEKKLDHKFRTKIIWVLENSLLNTLQFIDGELENNDNVEIKTTKFYIENGQQTGYLEICLYGDSDDSKKTVAAALQEDRVGKPKLEHQLRIELGINYSQYSNVFSISFETNTYWDGQNLDFDYLQKSIQKHLEKFDKEQRRSNKSFIGWINISIHPMHERYVLENKEKIEELLRTTKGDRQYKVVFCLNPQWGFDFKKAIIFEV
ncbi:hypothetical protein KAW18_11480 [candidate division WOR-3 bacterium]|nr:hypothetical protein [candidate division WOR-3 bacterium]